MNYNNMNFHTKRTCWENIFHKPQVIDLQILQVFFQHLKWFIMHLNHRNLWSVSSRFNTKLFWYKSKSLWYICKVDLLLIYYGLLLLYNNSEDMQFFHEFTRTINNSWLTNQSTHIDDKYTTVFNWSPESSHHDQPNWWWIILCKEQFSIYCR